MAHGVGHHFGGDSCEVVPYEKSGPYVASKAKIYSDAPEFCAFACNTVGASTVANPKPEIWGGLPDRPNPPSSLLQGNQPRKNRKTWPWVKKYMAMANPN